MHAYYGWTRRCVPSWMDSSVRESVLRKLRDAYKIDNLAKFQEEIIYRDELYYPTLRNILFSAPTGSGKSLVAETIACVNVLLSRKRCIFIEPYIASASELFFSLQRHWRSLGLIVKAHFGAASLSLQEEFDAVVCTIEKGASLISRLIKEQVLDQFCTIVIDEVHMTFDNDRGTLIEDLLIKLKFMNTFSIETVCQIIAMSATIEDPAPLEGLLNTKILDYSICEERDLDEYYVIKNKYYCQRKEQLALVERQPMFNFKSDETGILNLVMESVVEWKSVLIFCRTKALVEKITTLIAMCIEQCSKKENDTFKILGDRVKDCNLLSECGFMDTYIKTGVAFHHAGVPNEIRKKIETLYREKKIAVIVCTSTLSTGVNLPASRVLIILADNFGKSLNYVAYHQMIGRTGRRGFGRGDSYLVASDISQLRVTLSELKKKKFVPRPHDYTHLILDSISIGLIKTKGDAFRIASHCQNKLSRSLNEILESLRQSQLIGIEDNEKISVAITQLGSAISSSFLTPSEGHFIYKQLVRANASLDLRTDLQLLYLITPLPNRIGFKGLKLTNLFKYHEKLLTPTERDAAKKMGITNASCLKLSFGHREDEVHGRFYLALVLRELMGNRNEAEILREFGLNEMQLDLLKAQTIVYLKTIISITDQLGWHYLNILMKSFGQKVEMTISTDVIDLMHLPGIDGVRALAFVERGIESVRQLAMIDALALEKILRHTVPFKEGEKKGDKNEWLQGQITDCKTAVQTLVVNAEKFLKNRDSDKTFEFTVDESERSMETGDTICSLISNRRSCLERLCSNAKFLVLDYVEDHLQILNDDEDLMEIDFDIPECCKCSESVVDELEKLFSSTVPIFAKDLSFLFYHCKHHFLSVSFIQEHWTSFLSKFHCVLSILRVRNKTLDPDPEGLRSYFTSIVSRFCNKTLAEPCIYPLCRLIKNVILSQKISDHMVKLTSIWNESVQTSIYMSYYGIELNLEQVDCLRQCLQTMMTKTEEKIWKLTDQKFNIYKASSTRKVLSEINVFMDQNSRAPGSVDELSRTNHPIAELIVSARNAYTAYTQIEAIASHCDPDGRVRCFYNTLSHVTGRIGIENPPIQMLIKRKIIDGQSARGVFTAKDGCVLISADFSQLELRMILAMSRDETLARLINDDIDPFEYLSSSLREDGIHINRDTAKKLFYSIVYGIGASALSLDLNIDVRKAEKLISVFSTVFRGVDHWLKRVTQTALERHYAANIWGLGMGFAAMRSTEAKRRIPNYIIQSSVAYAFRVALNNIRTSFPKSMGGMVLQIHDEIICEVRRDFIHESIELIKKLMPTSLLGINFPVSIKIGPNWGQMEKIESSCG